MAKLLPRLRNTLYWGYVGVRLEYPPDCSVLGFLARSACGYIGQPFQFKNARADGLNAYKIQDGAKIFHATRSEYKEKLVLKEGYPNTIAEALCQQEGDIDVFVVEDDTSGARFQQLMSFVVVRQPSRVLRLVRKGVCDWRRPVWED
jgi:hypothetical protein